MATKKGKKPKNFENDIAPNKADFRNEETRNKAINNSIRTRKKKKMERMALQQCMKDLLNKKVVSENQKEALLKMGFDVDELTNQTLLMTALFRKGITGDTQAISKIIDMMDKLDMFNQGQQVTQAGVTINLIQKGETYMPTEQDNINIMRAENGEFEEIEIETDTDEDWGEDIYNG